MVYIRRKVSGVNKMHIGTSVVPPSYAIDPAFVARKAEELGFESIWYAERPVHAVNTTSPQDGFKAEFSANVPSLTLRLPGLQGLPAPSNLAPGLP